MYNSSPKMSLLLKWVQVEAMSTPWWCVWPSRQTGKADRRGLRGPIDAHSGTAYSKGSGKRIEFLGHFCCPIMWPVYFIKTKILIQSNSSGLASIAQNRIFTSWQDSLRRELIQKLAHGRKHSTVDSFWASRATFEGELRGAYIGRLGKPNSLSEILASSEKEQQEGMGYWVGF